MKTAKFQKHENDKNAVNKHVFDNNEQQQTAPRKTRTGYQKHKKAP